jgi:hypothetical protein
MRPVVSNPRAEELLIDRAVRGLDEREHHELDATGEAHDESYDAAAAAVAIAAARQEQLPAHLAARILADASENFTRTVPGTASLDDFKRTLTGVVVPAAPTAQRAPSPAPRVEEAAIPIGRARQRSRSAVIAWSAAAACLLIAGGALWWAMDQRAKVGSRVAHVNAPATPAEARATLLASARDAATIPWTASADPAGKAARGDVVWSASQQKGYMRFEGLAPNDPTQAQYQLWIFDKDRDQAFPVDGGVFDVASTGEVIVPIAAKLHVDDPTLFAVTVERPGGVVVSKRERIVVTAARG